LVVDKSLNIIARRLRRTNAHEECLEVLEEREIMSVGNARRNQSSAVSSINKDGVNITLEAAGVRAGDLLLLEDGPLSRKGFTKLMVYLWVDDINKLTAPAPQGLIYKYIYIYVCTYIYVYKYFTGA
jgi:hypothetical protein